LTKTATDARRALLPAFGAGAALSAMLFASRLPATLDFILPRRAGWPLFAASHEALARPGTRLAFTAGVSLLMIAALAQAMGNLDEGLLREISPTQEKN